MTYRLAGQRASHWASEAQLATLHSDLNPPFDLLYNLWLQPEIFNITSVTK